MKTAFERLIVYRLSEQLADQVWEMVLKWQRFESIGANIAEGTGRGSYQDNRRFVRTARGSLNETQHFLRRAFRRKLMTDTQIKTLKAIVDELAPRLNAYLKSIGPVSATDHGQLTTDN